MLNIFKTRKRNQIADPQQDLCVANKWKDVLNERSLIAKKRLKVKVEMWKGLKRCKGRKVERSKLHKVR